MDSNKQHGLHHHHHRHRHRKNKPDQEDIKPSVPLKGEHGISISPNWGVSRMTPMLPKDKQLIYVEILMSFRLDPVAKDKVMKIISHGIQENVRLSGKDGLPLRWCYVRNLPTVSVGGTCLVLNLCFADNFFRASLFDFDGDLGKSSSSKLLGNRVVSLPKEIRRATMETFCDYITKSLKEIIQERNTPGEATSGNIYLSVIAGFDVNVKPQRKPANAVVLSCFKDYRMYNFIGNDFVPYFHAAFKKADLKLEIGTVMNDAVAVLFSGIYQTSIQLNTAEDHQADCSISVMCNFGGANLAYLETDKDFLDSFLINTHKPLRHPMGTNYCAVMNTEAGFYVGSKKELNNVASSLEKDICETVNSPLRLEHITSGTWYPQLFKRAVRLLIGMNIIEVELDSSWNIEDSNVSRCFNVCDRWYATASQILDTKLTSELQTLMGIKHLNQICAGVIAETCNAIVSRTAEFIAISIMSIANRIYNKTFPKQMVVAYSGTMFTELSLLKEYVESSLNSMVQDSTEIILLKADEAVGSAVTLLSETVQP